ncbi:unnamed protein product [Clavelina lepadiformis]|uniref:Uncharacterized protein n=1 Tax=Clavelina lepadiformis TaxID=159417 RepID=A0ABP0GFJ1_CLALP
MSLETRVIGSKTSTKWSKYEPVSMTQSKTDHWAKMKHKATNFVVKMPEAVVITKQLPPDATRYKVNADGTIMPLKGPVFEDQLNNQLGNEKPGTYQKLRPKQSVSIPNKKKYRNEFNDRAREGFRYWPLSRPKATLYGKYGMGSYKSVLGLGDAVRT